MGYIIDIDGTLMNTDIPHTGAVDFINYLNFKHIDYLLMTNSIRNIDSQTQRLNSSGFDIDKNKVINPIIAINTYLIAHGISKARIIGTPEEIVQVKAENVNKDNEITILLDFEKGNIGYNELQNVLDDIENGVEVVTASISQFYYKSERKIIDTGAFVKIIEEISMKKIKNFGKPSLTYFEIAGNIMNKEPADLFVVGDDYGTDIKGANEWGANSILVKTGKYNKNDENLEPPKILVNRLSEILENI